MKKKEKKCSKCGKVKPIEEFVAEVNGEIMECRQCARCRAFTKKKPKSSEFWFEDFIYNEK